MTHTTAQWIIDQSDYDTVLICRTCGNWRTIGTHARAIREAREHMKLHSTDLTRGQLEAARQLLARLS